MSENNIRRNQGDPIASQTIYGNLTVTGAATFTGAIQSAASAHLLINTQAADKTVRINTKTVTSTSGDAIGFQSQIGQGANSSGNVIGCQIVPRVTDTFALTGSGSLIGAHVEAYLKGTTGNIAGHVRGMQIELTDDASSTRTVTGDSVGLRFRSAIEHTVTGHHVPILVETSEKGTTWEAVLKLAGNQAGIWKDSPGTEPTTADGYFKVLVNGNARYVQLYSGAPVD